jgi:hypothetical protein
MKAKHFTFIIVVLFMLGSISCDRDEEEVCSAVNCSDREVCIEGNCVDTLCLDTICYVCGDFVGDMDGEIQISIGLPEYFTDVPFSMEVNELASLCSYNVVFDISSLLGAPEGTLVPDFDGTLSDSTMNVANQVYIYEGVATITINGFVNYSSDFNEVNGSLDLTGDAVGSITFEGVRQ